MTIYILSHDQKECAEMLDDRSLDRMIRDIAQVLCNVHYDLIDDSFFEAAKYSSHCKETMGRLKYEIPLNPIFSSSNGLLQFSQWARECKANYLYLIELCKECVLEQIKRGVVQAPRKIREAYAFARDNVPDLSGSVLCEHPIHHEFPLFIPRKYIYWQDKIIDEGYGYSPEPDVISSYRNYYQAKLSQKTSCFSEWTNRQKPSWLNL